MKSSLLCKCRSEYETLEIYTLKADQLLQFNNKGKPSLVIISSGVFM